MTRLSDQEVGTQIGSPAVFESSLHKNILRCWYLCSRTNLHIYKIDTARFTVCKQNLVPWILIYQLRLFGHLAHLPEDYPVHQIIASQNNPGCRKSWLGNIDQICHKEIDMGWIWWMVINGKKGWMRQCTLVGVSPFDWLIRYERALCFLTSQVSCG